jgi:DNA-binding transcriptional MerR regulator/predicted RNase H-like HicB family nuclease
MMEPVRRTFVRANRGPERGPKPDCIELHSCYYRFVATRVTGFSAEFARKLAGISYRQLDYWDKTGLLRPSIRQARGKGSRRVYSFGDLVELRVIARLMAVGISLATVRKATRYLRLHFANVVRPLARLALVADGKRVLVKSTNGKYLVDASAGGQIVISLAVAPIVKDLHAKVTDLSAARNLHVGVAGRSYLAILTPDLESGGYSIAVPELPGVFSEADTISEARHMVADAIRMWLDAKSTGSAKAAAR